ncbi:MAG: hypothetical protein LBS62_03140 [Clostridiales bacterium]|jgi:ribosomal protein L31|nr:hypothetical protein [Clostridiales bacterium]
MKNLLQVTLSVLLTILALGICALPARAAASRITSSSPPVFAAGADSTAAPQNIRINLTLTSSASLDVELKLTGEHAGKFYLADKNGNNGQDITVTIPVSPGQYEATYDVTVGIAKPQSVSAGDTASVLITEKGMSEAICVVPISVGAPASTPGPRYSSPMSSSHDPMIKSLTSSSWPEFDSGSTEGVRDLRIDLTLNRTAGANVELRLTGPAADKFYLTDNGSNIGGPGQAITVPISSVFTDATCNVSVVIVQGQTLNASDTASIVISEKGMAAPSYTIPISIHTPESNPVINNISSSSPQPQFTVGSTMGAQDIRVDLTLRWAACADVELRLTGRNADKFYLTANGNSGAAGQPITVMTSGQMNTTCDVRVEIAAGKTLEDGDAASIAIREKGVTGLSYTIPIDIHIAEPNPTVVSITSSSRPEFAVGSTAGAQDLPIDLTLNHPAYTEVELRLTGAAARKFTLTASGSSGAAGQPITVMTSGQMNTTCDVKVEIAAGETLVEGDAASILISEKGVTGPSCTIPISVYNPAPDPAVINITSPSWPGFEAGSIPGSRQDIDIDVTLDRSAAYMPAGLELQLRLTGASKNKFYLIGNGNIIGTAGESITLPISGTFPFNTTFNTTVTLVTNDTLAAGDTVSIVISQKGKEYPSCTIPITIGVPPQANPSVIRITNSSWPEFEAGSTAGPQNLDIGVTLNSYAAADVSLQGELTGDDADKFYLTYNGSSGSAGGPITIPIQRNGQDTITFTVAVGIAEGKTLDADDTASIVISEQGQQRPSHTIPISIHTLAPYPSIISITNSRTLWPLCPEFFTDVTSAPQDLSIALKLNSAGVPGVDVKLELTGNGSDKFYLKGKGSSDTAGRTITLSIANPNPQADDTLTFDVEVGIAAGETLEAGDTASIVISELGVTGPACAIPIIIRTPTPYPSIISITNPSTSWSMWPEFYTDMTSGSQDLSVELELNSSAVPGVDVQLQLTGQGADKFYLKGSGITGGAGDTITIPIQNLEAKDRLTLSAEVGIAEGVTLEVSDTPSIVISEAGVTGPTCAIPIIIRAPMRQPSIRGITSASRPSFEVDSDKDAATQDISIDLTLNQGALSSVRVKAQLTGEDADNFYFTGNGSGGGGQPLTLTVPIPPTSGQDKLTCNIAVGIAEGKTVEADDTAAIVISEAEVTGPSCTIPISIGTPQTPQTPPQGAITGTAKLWANGTESLLGGAYIYVYDSTGQRYIGSAISAPEGAYAFNIPAGSASLTGYLVSASSNLSFANSLINEDETAVVSSWDGNYKTVPDQGGGVANFTFIKAITITGRVVDNNGNPIPGAAVSESYTVETETGGTFEAQTNVNATGSRQLWVYVYASGYYSAQQTNTHNVSVNDFKRGYIDIGDITLQKIPSAGVYSDHEKNSFIVTPNFVVPNEVSYATLKLNADALSAREQVITVETNNSAEIMVTKLEDINITKDGAKADVNSFNFAGSKLEIRMNIEPNANYQFKFSIKAPGIGENYTVAAKAGGATIGQAIVILHGLDLTVPPEVKPNQKFVIYGDVVIDDNVDLELAIKDQAGAAKYTAALNVSKNMGVHYKFTDITLLEPGNYVATVTSKQNGAPLKTAQANIRVVDEPIVITEMWLKDDYNQVSKPNPAPGEYLTFNGWVHGDLWSQDYRNLRASVTLGGDTSGVTKAQFIIKTSHGTFLRPQGSAAFTTTFSADLNSYRGTGKADVLYEITKSDGSVLTFVVGKLILLIDPSGYIYNSDTREFVKGAVVTLFYKNESGAWAQWPAERYDQQNPLKSDDKGKYGWMVPEGQYYITVTCAGYADYDMLRDGRNFGENGVLTVLPEQTEINIGLKPIGGSEDPGIPVTPTPENPGIPVTPTPENPSVPVTPTPENPSVPVTPTPENPGVPVTPTPENPSVPVTPTPENPGIPVTPTPENPSVPVTPTPENPSIPVTPTPENPAPSPGGSGSGSSGSGSSGGSSYGSSGLATVTAQTAPRVTLTLSKTSMAISNALRAGKPIVIELLGSMNTAAITGAKLNSCAKLNLPVTITRGIYSVTLSPEAIRGLKLTDSQAIEIAVSKPEGVYGANAEKLRAKGGRNSQLLSMFCDVELSVDNTSVESYSNYVAIRIDSAKLGLTEPEKKQIMAVGLNGQGITCLGGKFDGDVFEFAVLRGGRYGLAVLPEARRVELAINKNTYHVNGVQREADVAPIIYGGSTIVPIRFVAESLGAEVAWNAVLRSVSISLFGNLFNMTIGTVLHGMPVPPMIIDGRTFVPLRYVSETLGATVYWHDKTKSIEIFYAGN